MTYNNYSKHIHMLHPIRGDLSSMDERTHSSSQPPPHASRGKDLHQIPRNKIIPWNQWRIPWMEY